MDQNHIEIHQTSQYMQYMRLLGWKTIPTEWGNLFLRYIPLYGVLAKAQRFDLLPSVPSFVSILKSHSVKSLSFEPSLNVSQEKLTHWTREISHFYSLSRSPFIPTKTIYISLAEDEKSIFNRFSEAKRRASRRAINLGVKINESRSISTMITIKSKSAGFLGWITTKGMKELWECFGPTNASILLSYADETSQTLTGGVFLLHSGNKSYYWIAGATKKGKKTFAPTLLVWEAIKLSKKKGSEYFDFMGVFDERYTTEHRDWLGFTRFKDGFGGNPKYYPAVWNQN